MARPGARGWIVPAALLAAARIAAGTLGGAALPPLEKPPLAEHAVQDVGFVLAGARRVGGDLAFIQLLQYFATDDGNIEKPKSQWLPKFLPHSLRFAALSPHFHAAFLYSAGCLGFVLDRPDEALRLLALGASRDPAFWRYRLYAGAIGYRISAETEKVVALLEEALKYPDCPSLLQNILANLHKRLGNNGRAAEIYRHIIATSRDEHEAWRAEQELKKLIEKRLAL